MDGGQWTPLTEGDDADLDSGRLWEVGRIKGTGGMGDVGDEGSVVSPSNGGVVRDVTGGGGVDFGVGGGLCDAGVDDGDCSFGNDARRCAGLSGDAGLDAAGVGAGDDDSVVDDAAGVVDGVVCGCSGGGGRCKVGSGGAVGDCSEGDVGVVRDGVSGTVIIGASVGVRSSADVGCDGVANVLVQEYDNVEATGCSINSTVEIGSFINYGVHSSSRALVELTDLRDKGSFYINLGESSDSRFKGSDMDNEERRL